MQWQKKGHVGPDGGTMAYIPVGEEGSASMGDVGDELHHDVPYGGNRHGSVGT